ncbi:MAG: metallophosphoesterase [Clostridia bacterium]|nr:metallophosphoesterase [Clostridia bacterium]
MFTSEIRSDKGYGNKNGERSVFKKIIAALSVFVVTALSLACFSSCKKEKYVYDLSMKTDAFKILQLTDLHFINSQITGDGSVKGDYTLRDEWVQTAVTEIVEKADPDMIVVTGDIVFTTSTIKSITGTNDNYEAFKKAARFIDGFGIPWAFVFGNHDEEGSLLQSTGSKEKTKKVLGEYLMSKEIRNCLFSGGPEEINGYGNYVINVRNKDKSVHTSLVFFDSGSCLTVYDESKKRYVTGMWNYEYVHDDQLDWYEETLQSIFKKEGKTVPSIVFQHIPLPVYQTALDAYMKALEEKGEAWKATINANWEYGREYTLDTEIGPVTYYGGVCNKEDQEVCHSFVGRFGGVEFDGGHEFERILALGSTKHVFCGHDHRNTFSFSYQGVRLTYGMSVDYSAVGLVSFYPNQNIYDETEQRGGTLITLKKDGDTEVSQVPFTRNLYRETLAARNAEE